MSFYNLYNARKEAYVFLHSLILSVSSCVRMNRRTERATRKALPNTTDAKEWGQGIPVPWFTGPPSKPSFYDYEITIDGLKKWTKPHWKCAQAHF